MVALSIYAGAAGWFVGMILVMIFKKKK